MYVLLALIVLQTASPSVKPKHPIVQNSAGSSATNASPKNSADQLPPADRKNAGVPSAKQSTPNQDYKKQDAADRVYKVDVVSPPAKPLDTPLFPIYLIITGIGVFINLWIACLIFGQSKLIRHQVRTSHISTKAAVRSARAAKKSADTAKMALELAERADVLLDGIFFADAQGHITPHTQPIFFFKNTGRTRAVNVKLLFHLTVPGAKESRFSDLTSITIGSQCRQRLAFQTLIECFNRETFEGIVGGSIPLTFEGKITYDDAFGKAHWAAYSGSYDAGSRTFRVDKHETSD